MIEIRDGVEGKVCNRCKLWKSLAEFHRCKSNKDGKQGYCKPCNLEAVRSNPNTFCLKCGRRRGDFKDYGGSLDEEFGKNQGYCKVCLRKLKHEKLRFYPSQIMWAEKRRIIENGLDGKDRGTCHPYEWKLYLLAYGNKCLVPDCINVDVTNDHIQPLSKDGSNEIWNRQGLCRSHNSSKNNHNNIDYRPDQGILAMAIHNLRIGQWDNKQEKKQYFEWVCQQIKDNSPQILLTIKHIDEWAEETKENK